MKKQDNKKAIIQFKLEKTIKEKFFEKCKKKAINPSAWLRNKIQDFLDNDD